MRLYVAPYKLGSESARLIARTLGALRTEGNKGFRHPSMFINWGNGSLSVTGRGVRKILNPAAAVAVASNKLSAFRAFSQHSVPTLEYTTSQAKAREWLEADGIVYGRSILTGSQGAGIKVITADDYSFPNCPLYTRAMNTGVHEYRVHIAGGKVIDFVRKRRREGGDGNEYVRNIGSGWVFCRNDEALPPTVAAASLMAVASVGLDFGAVDILHKHRESKVAVLEVNTAPGIEGTTLDKYISYFRRSLNVSTY